MKCPQCWHENPDDAKFCNECAHTLELTCPACGKVNRPGSKFCNECAHKLMPPADPAPEVFSFDKKLEKIQRYLPQGLTEKILSQRDRIEGERRQVTVMFCDMEGFTPLSEKLGNEDAYVIMEQLYEILIHKVHDYEGTVNEMTGDGIMALFGAPIALEDAAQRAIRSSLAIHREMAKFSDRMKQENKGLPALKMRIGIHTGPVVVGTLGNNFRVEFKAVGDTVNLASRMEGLAEAGSTYVTQEIFKLTEGLFRFEAMGARAVKGKEEPINVYRVLSPSTLRTRFDISAESGLTPFVGRERELELLIDGFERCKQGRGQAFSIVAEAGVGKSRFLYEFRKDVINEDATFLEGKCLSYSRSVAYHPVIDILKSNFDIKEGDGDSEIISKVKKGLEILKADKDSTLPYLLDLLSVKDSGIDQKSLSPETRRNRIVEALIQILLKGSEIRPLIMAIEDLHWTDTGSEETLKNLLESISGARVFLLFTYRPEFVTTWGGRSYHSQINLNRLSNRESLKMVSYLLGTENIEGALADLILEKTEGVPFFIEEFIKSLKNLRIIKSKNGHYYLAKKIQEMSIPATIQDVIMARVDSLPEEAREMLQRGSAIEREFSHKLIQQVIDLPEQQLLSCLSALKDAELLYERGIYPDSTYIFKHALTREVVYDSILTRKKKQLHKKIGQAIQEIYSGRLEEFYEMLAHHYYEGEDWETALDYLVKAGDKAIATYANQEALDYYARALKVCEKLGTPVLATSLDLAKKRGLVNSTIGNFREAIEDFNQMCAAARNLGNRHLEALALAYRGWTEQYNHDMQTAENTLKAALSLANEDFEDVRLFASVTLGDLFLAFNRHQEGEPILRKAEQLAPRVDDPLILTWWSISGSRWLNWKGRFNDALKLQQQYQSAFKGGSEAFLVNLWVESLARIGKGEYRKALEILEDVREKAKRIGSVRVRVRVLNTLGWLYEELQDHRQAMAWNLEGLEAAKEANFPHPEIKNNARLNLGDNLLALGSLDDAEKHFNKVESVVRNPRFQDHYALWRYSQHHFHSYGELWLARGNLDKALAYADECLALAKLSDSKKNIVKGKRLRGQVFLSQGKLAEAEQELSVALSIAQQVGNPTQIWKTFDALGRLRQMQSRIEETRQAYVDALAVIEKVASNLKNNSLEQTFLNSILVQEIRQKVERKKERLRTRDT